MNITLIKWIDAVSTAGWQDAPSAPSENISVGHIVHEDDMFIQLATTLCEHSDMFVGTISIPLGMITSRSNVFVEDDADDKQLVIEFTYEDN